MYGLDKYYKKRGGDQDDQEPAPNEKGGIGARTSVKGRASNPVSNIRATGLMAQVKISWKKGK